MKTILMQVTAGQVAPDFKITDVAGNPISLSQFKGQKIHLAFYRFAGCPFCNLRFHEINKLSADYLQNGVVLISIYESSTKNLSYLVAGEQFYSLMIANEDSSLYKLYSIGRSKLGLLSFVLFKGGLSRILKGMKLFKQKVAIDGHSDRMEAEFLIEKDGTVALAYYGSTPGDNLPIGTIRTFVNG